MKFSEFSEYLSQIEQVSSRLKMTELLSELYQKLAPKERAIATYLMQGQLVPDYESLEFQLSEKMVQRALAFFTVSSGDQASLFGEDTEDSKVALVKKSYKEIGDLGEVAFTLLKDQIESELSVQDVYDQLAAIARHSGAGSQERKLQLTTQLLQQVSALSAKYIVRIILGKMRLGFSKMTLLDALSWAMTGDKSEHAILEDAYQKRADIGSLAAEYLTETNAERRQQKLAEMTVEWGVPVVPALCQRLNTAQEVIEKMGQVYVEPKYDGMRVQVHVRRLQPSATATDKNKEEVQVKVFTRNLENIGHMFPEFSQLAAQMTVDTAVFDGEVIGYNTETGELLPFQETMTRRRKHNVSEQAAAVPVKLFIFDVLMAANESLLTKKLRERKELLKSIIKENEVFLQTKYVSANEPEEIRSFHTSQLGAGLEGVVIKQVNSIYQSGRKGWSWVKMKEAEGTQGKLSDTLDLVVLGYYRGRGKRASFGIGAFLVGVVAEDQTTLKTISKIGTGLSDEQFGELKNKADALATPTQPKNYEVPKELQPDVWIAPGLVVEIAADELTRSPLHTAGLALRFPRLVRFRDDKSWQEATTQLELQTITIS